LRGPPVPGYHRLTPFRFPIIRAVHDHPLDLLAIVAHPDDAELICGGTLARTASRGRRVGILDLTRGESGSRGSAEVRTREAEEAAAVLGIATRLTANLPDAGLIDDDASRLAVVRLLRDLRPGTLILHPDTYRHPDHGAAHRLGRHAAFLSGLTKIDTGQPPHRPEKILFATAFREDAGKPTFVVDISTEIETKMRALGCYASQFEGKTWAGEVFPGGDRPLLEQVRMHAARYGSLIRTSYGEPFWTVETLAVDDVTALGVRSL
jgi:N-acetylglucosamine malate deacetylase 1